MSRLKDIIAEVKDRLESAGFSANSRYFVDPEIDDLPMVSVLIDKRQGVQESGRSSGKRQKMQVRLAIEHTRDDPGDDMEQFADIQQEIYEAIKGRGTDYTERLGGLALEVEHHKSTPVHDEREKNLAVTQVLMDVTYREE